MFKRERRKKETGKSNAIQMIYKMLLIILLFLLSVGGIFVLDNRIEQAINVLCSIIIISTLAIIETIEKRIPKSKKDE